MKNNQGTLQGSVGCAYSEPGRCLLTVSAAPVINDRRGLGQYKLFAKTLLNSQDIPLANGGLWSM